jgi:AcrR family transcriptional regulator
MPEATITKLGRPRDPHVDEAILSAALALLIEDGFPRLTIEGVAARAGVGKATIYRRWESKTALVVDAINERVACGIAFPDSGDFRADVEAVLTQVLLRIQGLEGKVWKAVLSELVRNEELAEMFRREFVVVRRADMMSRVKAAMDNGQLPPGDVELLADVGSAMIHHRLLLSGEPLTDDLPKRILNQFFPKAVTP